MEVSDGGKKKKSPLIPDRIAQHAATVTKERVREIVENTEEPFLSIRNLMSKQESNVIISDPREYQVELFEKAKQQNIIAVLDTGLCCPSSLFATVLSCV